MWIQGYTTIVKDVKAEDIWALWTDVNNWHKWDDDIEYAHLEGPHKVGATFTLKPKNGPKVKIKLIECEYLKKYVDYTILPLAKMYGIHEMEIVEGGVKLTTSMKVTGSLSFLWRKLIAENIVKGLPKQTEALVALARMRGTQ